MTSRAFPAGSFLDGLDPETSALLRHDLERVAVSRGTLVCAEGDPADALYIVEAGRLQATRQDARGRRVLREIGRGETVGELALLTGDVRTATVTTVRDSVLWRLPRAVFDRVARTSPEATLALARLLARRAATGEERTALPATLALVPCGRGSEGGAFAEKLLTALRPRRPLLVDRALVARRLGLTHGEISTSLDRGAATSRLLDDLESEHPLVVYVGDASGDPSAEAWTRLCIDHADRVLRVVSGDDPGLSPLEESLAPRGRLRETAREELVRLVPDDARLPQGTSAFLASRAVDAHHHVRLGVPADLDRLARRVAGRPLGVALSGGGYRCFAQLGLFLALEEAGVSVDLIVGTSAGALIGAQVARGDRAQVIVDRTLSLLAGRVFDPTLPLVSLLAGYRYRRILRGIFGGTRLEDLWLSCHMVSADLASAEVMVHDDGPLWLAARASGSPPGLVPPVRWGDRLLVDGGVLNNLPSDVVREKAPDALVIGCDVSSPAGSLWATGGADAISGWRVLWDRMRGGPRAAGMADIILRASTLAASRHLATVGAGQADLYLRPAVEGFGSFDKGAIPAIVAAGHEQARRAVSEWMASGRLVPGGWTSSS